MTAPTPPSTLVLLTCSMARDRELFALLARSVDELVDPAIPHRVVVPRRDLAAFRPFSGPRREILAQEEVLPFATVRIPALPRAAARLSQTFRRPFYLDRRLRMIRGWILQQALKIEMSRRAAEDLVLHVDSDVFFVRPVAPRDVFRDGRMPFFRATGRTGNPLHGAWTEAAARLLGLRLPADYPSHYIENCVPWQAQAVRALIRRIEETHGRAWYDVLLGEKTFSEYYLYGLFLDEIHGTGGLYTEQADLCRSYWPKDERAAVDEAGLLAGLQPHHVAVALQSTIPLPVARRQEIYLHGRATGQNAGGGAGGAVSS